MSEGQREYELVVFGATGYTGKYPCEHITTHLPTDLKWAAAGRSANKLEALVKELKQLNPDRIQPGVEAASLSKDDLMRLAKKTRVLITTVGPYHQYGTAVVEACAETGTHYLDCTGEVPWVHEILHKCESTAKRNGAIMIPQNGIESAPSDLMVWALVSHIKQVLGDDMGVGEVVQTTYDMKAAPSGGTLATVLTLFDSYSIAHLQESGKPWALAAVSPEKRTRSKALIERVTGGRYVSDLGQLTDSLQGPADIPIVNRTWSLIDGGKYYGPNFHVGVYARTRNTLTGLGVHLAMTFGLLALLLPPVRWLFKRFVFQPGDGPTRDSVKHDYVEWRAIANADVSDPLDPKKAFGRMRWEGSAYHLTGVCLAEAAVTILREKTLAHQLGGGILTPATLGVAYLDRLQKAGLRTEIRMVP